MSTKHELQTQAAKLQAELSKLNSAIASMKDELPEGFVPFEATATSKCPCHPKDIVLWSTGANPSGDEDKYKKEAGRLCWTNDTDERCCITGYKIVKKYVGPRPMKFSEIPIGQAFEWRNSLGENPVYYDGVYIKMRGSQGRPSYSSHITYNSPFYKFYTVSSEPLSQINPAE